MEANRMFRALLFVLIGAFVVSANAQDKPVAQSKPAGQGRTTAPDRSAVPDRQSEPDRQSASDKLSEYRIGLGDTINIKVFQNPDLALETRVSESGVISYPLIGMVKVGGMTLSEAEQVIAAALQKGGFIQQPQVSIGMVTNRGNQVSVLGHVIKAGRYALDTAYLRLSDILAIAGGVAADAGDSAVITGTRDGKPFRKVINIEGMFLDDKLAQDDILVAGGDVIYVHRQSKYYIYGEVKTTGYYKIERNMTIRQALALGGGPTTKSSERNIVIYRRNTKGVVEKITPSLNDPVQPEDVIQLTESLF